VIQRRDQRLGVLAHPQVLVKQRLVRAGSIGVEDAPDPLLAPVFDRINQNLRIAFLLD